MATTRGKRAEVYVDPGLQKLIDQEFPAAPQVAFFFDGVRRDERASEQHGHDVYVRAPFVRIQIQGERDFISLAATSEHTERFPVEWQRYKSRPPVGTSLLALPTMDHATARTIAELGLPTVEDVAHAEIVDAISPRATGIDLGDPLTDSAGPDVAMPEAPRVLPRWLAKWQMIARQYLVLKNYAETGQKPRVRLESAA